MNDAPERIWAVPAIGGTWKDDLLFTSLKPIKSPKSREYIRADLMPRWRPIAELPKEWKDGRAIVLRFSDGDITTFDGMDAKEWRQYLHFIKPLTMEFLDFGGKSMPD